MVSNNANLQKSKRLNNILAELAEAEKKYSCGKILLDFADIYMVDSAMTNFEIVNKLETLGYCYQHNTIAKELSFLISKGKVKSRRVDGKTYCEYQVVVDGGF